MNWSFIVGRILYRTGVGVWRHRLLVLAAAVLGLGFSAYELTLAGPSATTVDCADTAMAAVTHVDDGAARAAYACLGPGMRNTSEDQFVAGMRDRAIPNGIFDRVADRRTSDGGHIVFFTVDAGKGGTAVGYIVYLDPQGKISRVE